MSPPIDNFNVESISGFTGKTIVGFFSATHGFNLPHSMLKFLVRFNVLKGSDIFIGNTRAGMKLSKLFLPGLSGIALYLPAFMMFLKDTGSGRFTRWTSLELDQPSSGPEDESDRFYV